jgi:hypothetical protein
MKKFKIALSVMLTLVMAIVCMAVPASAASSSNVKKWAVETNIDLAAKKTKKSTTYLKFTTEGAGVLSFYFSTDDSKLTKASKYELLNAKKKTLKSGKLSALATKTFKLSKGGTFYLKVTLAKGESIKYFRHYFYANGAKPTATEEWLKGYIPTDADLAQVSAAFSSFIWATGTNDAQFFKEGEISEHQALDWIINNCLGFLNVYGYDISEGTEYRAKMIEEDADWAEKHQYANVLPAKAVDDTMYHLFGIKATHKVNTPYKYYEDGYYYYTDGGRGNYDELRYVSTEAAKDGRYLIKFLYSVFDFDNGDFDDPKYIESDVYALISVHQTDGKNYVRIHAIYNGEKPAV